MNETRLQRPVVRVPLSEEQKNPLKEAFHGFLDAWHAAEDHPAPAATVLVEAVRRLSEIYTARREESPFRNRRLLQARLHFFMPTDIPKIWLPLGELMARRPELLERPVLRLLDLGAGAGTASLGALVLLKVLGYRGTVRITAVEPDPLLRDPLLRALDVAGESLGIPLEVTHHTAGLQPWLAASPPRSGSREERWDLALALDVLTEALAPEAYPEEGLELARRLLRRLDPGGAAILVEPALREPSRRLSRLRDRLRAEGLPVFAPCLAEGPCPELAADGYCFHAIQVPLNAWLQKLGDLAGLRRHEVNFHYLTLAPDATQGAHLPPDLPGPHARLISFPAKSRMGFQFHACCAEGLLRVHLARWCDVGAGEPSRTRHLPQGTSVSLAD